MTTNAKQEALRRTVVELIELEGTLERTLGTALQKWDRLLKSARRCGGTRPGKRVALEAYLATLTDADGSGAERCLPPLQ